MKPDTFMRREWQKLCESLHQTAEYFGLRSAALAELAERQATEFCDQDAPVRYPEYLERVGQAAKLAQTWREEAQTGFAPVDQHAASDDQKMVDEAGEESFPASDPPAWTTTAI